eukprot:1123188-Amphidinium_carterae.1
MRFRTEHVFVNSQDSTSPHSLLVHHDSASLTAVGSLQQRPGCKGSLGHCTEASSVDMDEMADFTPEAQQPQ